MGRANSKSGEAAASTGKEGGGKSEEGKSDKAAAVPAVNRKDDSCNDAGIVFSYK